MLCIFIISHANRLNPENHEYDIVTHEVQQVSWHCTTQYLKGNKANTEANACDQFEAI